MFLIWIKEDTNLGKLSDFFLFQIIGPIIGSKQNMYYRCSDTVVSFWQHPCPGHFTFGQIKHPSLPPHRYFLISEDPVDPVRSSGGSIKLGSKRRLNWPEPPMSESLLQEYIISPPILPTSPLQPNRHILTHYPEAITVFTTLTLTLSDPHKGMKDEVGF